MKRVFSIFTLIILLILSLTLGCDDGAEKADSPIDMPYSVEIDPADFKDSNITGNAFFPLIPGTTLVYEGENEEGISIRVEEKITTQTKVVMEIICVVVEVKEWEDDELIEETSDWYAQDKQGNVWYFGEDSKEFEDGEVVSTAGSWEAGLDGALPGIIMLANPIEGLWYRQEFRAGEAEDVAQIVSRNETVSVHYGDFSECLQTAEWNPLEPGIMEYKFYASGVGLVSTIAVKGESGFEELVDIIVE